MRVAISSPAIKFHTLNLKFRSNTVFPTGVVVYGFCSLTGSGCHLEGLMKECLFPIKKIYQLSANIRWLDLGVQCDW